MKASRLACSAILGGVLLMAGIEHTPAALADDRSIPVQEQQTAQERHRAFEAEHAREITPQSNAARHIRAYMTAPEFRDEAYAEELAELGIDLPPDELPYFMEWFTYHYEVLDDNREAREQHQLTTRSDPIDPETIPEVIKWLEIVSPAMDAMRDAVAKPHFWIPHHPPDQAQFSYIKWAFHYRQAVIPVEHLIEAYMLRSRYYLATDQIDLAVTDLITADRLNKLLSQFMDLDVLESCNRYVGRLDRVLSPLLATHRLSDAQLARLQEQWMLPQDGFTSQEIIDHWERLWLIDYLERVASGAEEEPSFLLVQLSMGGPVDDSELEGWGWMLAHELFDTERAIERVNAQYDWLISLHVDDDFSATQARLDEATAVLRERMMRRTFDLVENIYTEQEIPTRFDSDRYTDTIVDFLMIFLAHPNRILDGPYESFDSRAHRTVGVTAIALSRYRLEHQAYPDVLNDLVPVYLEEVPTDPYTDGAPLRYSRSGDRQSCRILSVGSDQEDSQGEGYNDIYIDLD